MKLEIPSRWRVILSAVQEVSPGAIIGGGALRDLDNDKPVKDLDIFVSYMPFDTPRQDVTPAMLRLNPWYSVTQDISSDYMGADAFEVAHILEMQDLDKDWPDLNIIMVREGQSPVEDSARYDFGLCQIYFDGQDVVATDAYHGDKADKTLTLCRCNTPEGFQRSMRRARRLFEKYPDHRLVVPPQFQGFA